MAVYKIFPEKDTSIYTESPTANAGLDEILEIGSYPYQTVGKSIRTLIYFPSDEIKQVIEQEAGSTAISASIRLFLAFASELPYGYSIEAAPVSSSWVNGTGKFGDIPINIAGANWKTVDGVTPWDLGTSPNVTASYQSTLPGGGDWYTGSLGFNLVTSQSHGRNSTHDLNIDVTNAVKLHYSSSIGQSGIPNNGFIIKLPDSYEFETTSSIRLKYFGVDTHTIYPPCLEIKWDDSTFNTGSATTSIINTTQTYFNITNNRSKFTDVEKYRFRIRCRPEFPTRTFSTTSNYLVNYYLPQNSYWGIKDEDTEEMVIDFDSQFTKISADSNSSYFDIYMGGLQPNRTYRVLIKTTIDGSTMILDENVLFKVVRNG